MIATNDAADWIRDMIIDGRSDDEIGEVADGIGYPTTARRMLADACERGRAWGEEVAQWALLRVPVLSESAEPHRYFEPVRDVLTGARWPVSAPWVTRFGPPDRNGSWFVSVDAFRSLRRRGPRLWLDVSEHRLRACVDTANGQRRRDFEIARLDVPRRIELMLAMGQLRELITWPRKPRRLHEVIWVHLGDDDD